jgi:hypothetical protein
MADILRRVKWPPILDTKPWFARHCIDSNWKFKWDCCLGFLFDLIWWFNIPLFCQRKTQFLDNCFGIMGYFSVAVLFISELLVKLYNRQWFIHIPTYFGPIFNSGRLCSPRFYTPGRNRHRIRTTLDTGDLLNWINFSADGEHRNRALGMGWSSYNWELVGWYSSDYLINFIFRVN